MIAESGVGGLAWTIQKRPTIVVLSLCLPDANSFEVAQEMMINVPDVRILAFSTSSDPYAIHNTRNLGLHSFIDCSWDTIEVDLKIAISHVLYGRKYFPVKFRERVTDIDSDPCAFHKLLSASEEAVLDMIAVCADDAEIAQNLKISASTAQSHRRNIMKKLGIHSTPKLIRYAWSKGFGRRNQLASDKGSGHAGISLMKANDVP